MLYSMKLCTLLRLPPVTCFMWHVPIVNSARGYRDKTGYRQFLFSTAAKVLCNKRAQHSLSYKQATHSQPVLSSS